MTSNERLFEPSLLTQEAFAAICAVIEESSPDDPLRTSELLKRLAIEGSFQSEEAKDPAGLRFSVAASILADLVEQGWALRTIERKIFVRPPEPKATHGETRKSAKARLRNSLLIASDRQLATGAVQDFIKSMERDRIFEDRIVSIKSIIDDGNDLADQIAIALQSSTSDEALGRIIKPVLQVCESDSVCEFTGLRLQDIWRYFRHTWSLEYNPLPGRTLRFLIRNKARRNWPVMGIAMLASPAANLYSRDQWIGWTVDELVARLLDGRWDATYVAKSLMKVLDDAISGIRTDDLVSPEELRNPTKATIFRLQHIAFQAEARRRRDLTGETTDLIDIRSFGKKAMNDEDWFRLSGTALFVRKRAEQLLPLLQTLAYFKDQGIDTEPAAALYELLITKRGRDSVNLVLNEIRKQRLATEVADISVCGAIPPYNHLLGGKLVALSMMSREARDGYTRRYATQASEIASQLAGRAVIRPAKLKVLTTTSLYGIGSSQYNRLKLKAATYPQLRYDLEWEELRPTKGYTVTHLSKRTVEYMRQLAKSVYGRRRINSVFGEGSSPRTRQIREGLNLIGINNNDVMKQGLTRRVYACELFPGARESLIGLSKASPIRQGPTMKEVGSAWLRRWVNGRVMQPDTIQNLRRSDTDHISRELRLRAERARLEDESSDAPLDLSQLELPLAV